MTIAAIDSNVLVGLLDKKDTWHNEAVLWRDALVEAAAEVVYFDCVINEVMTVFARRTSEQGRRDELEALLDGLERLVPVGDVTWIGGEVERLYKEILQLIRTSGEISAPARSDWWTWSRDWQTLHRVPGGQNRSR